MATTKCDPPVDGAKEATKREAAPPLTLCELAVPVFAVITTYCSLLVGLHLRQTWAARAAAEGVNDTDMGNYWGTLPSAWDHPEPNYLVSEAIGEFWSVLTTIPVAGTMLLYEGLKYKYGKKVLGIYGWTCLMYSLAFSAHLTLQKLVFSTTVTSVMSNALLTFAMFSSIVHRWLKSRALRGMFVLGAEAAIIFTVAWLPYSIKNGGVWTLFYVQSPGVFLATGIAALMLWTSKRREETMTYRTVFGSGILLSSAMILSYFECTYGFEHGILTNWWGFPWLHIAIHVFEQIGIYLYGVGTASLQELLFEEQVREGAEIRHVGFGLPYLYCPYPRGDAPAKADEKEEEASSDDAGEPAEAATPADATPSTAMPTAGGADAKTQFAQKRSRIQSPGPPVVRKG